MRPARPPDERYSWLSLLLLHDEQPVLSGGSPPSESGDPIKAGTKMRDARLAPRAESTHSFVAENRHFAQAGGVGAGAIHPRGVEGEQRLSRRGRDDYP